MWVLGARGSRSRARGSCSSNGVVGLGSGRSLGLRGVLLVLEGWGVWVEKREVCDLNLSLGGNDGSGGLSTVREDSRRQWKVEGL